jgi:exodeoxyribonuclease I
LLELESLATLHEDNAEKMAQLKALYLYAQELVS